jgi:flavin reductase (DIM6/NTAB) family NADH-FMN oxidoreductase RutF
MQTVEKIGRKECLASLDFRDALSKTCTAVTVVATNGPSGLAGLTCSAVCSVCDQPSTVLLCVNRKSRAASIIKSNGVLSVNWLASDQAAISQIFAGVGSIPMAERFEGDGWQALETGAPCRTDALVSFDCTVVNTLDVGSHMVIFAEVVAEMHSEKLQPLIHHRRTYATTRSLAD